MLALDHKKVEACRLFATHIAHEIDRFNRARTTVAIERATLRIIGIDGVDEEGIPLVNLLVEQAVRQDVLGEGIIMPLLRTMDRDQLSMAETVNQLSLGQLLFQSREKSLQKKEDDRRLQQQAFALAETGLAIIAQKRRQRDHLIKGNGEGKKPLLYVIVATGDIIEDVKQAQAAAYQGADIVAVIRSTGQSLLDFVPHGLTREGFGGTYATQANFRLMREGLDEVGEKIGRYIRLCNYCSGLCMPEIAAMGGIERLDVMLNDALYGILFRDINMQRTLADQYFSRMINSYAGIIINTGEDNYLTTADAIESAHTVLASQFINEQLAFLSGLPSAQLGLGHACEINPDLENGLLYEIAHAQLIRQVFPDASLKYMPPTKHMTGNIFKGHIQDALFNLVGVLTGQGIQLLGMMTEAMHTPHIHDRFLAIQNAQYIFNNARDLGQEVIFKNGGLIERRAQNVLEETYNLLKEVEQIGLFKALENGLFADVKRPFTGGRGLEGVVLKREYYCNPVETLLREKLQLPKI